MDESIKWLLDIHIENELAKENPPEPKMKPGAKVEPLPNSVEELMKRRKAP